MQIRFIEEADVMDGMAGTTLEVTAPPLVGQKISNPITGTVTRVHKLDFEIDGVDYLVIVRKG